MSTDKRKVLHMTRFTKMFSFIYYAAFAVRGDYYFLRLLLLLRLSPFYFQKGDKIWMDYFNQNAAEHMYQ